MDFSTGCLAYLGPETVLPMTSVVAGLAGFLMMFGRNSWLWLRKLTRLAVSGVSTAPQARRRIGETPVGGIARGVSRRARISR